MRALLIILTLIALGLALAGLLPSEVLGGIALICLIVIAFAVCMSGGALLADKNERR